MNVECVDSFQFFFNSNQMYDNDVILLLNWLHANQLVFSNQLLLFSLRFVFGSPVSIQEFQQLSKLFNVFLIRLIKEYKFQSEYVYCHACNTMPTASTTRIGPTSPAYLLININKNKNEWKKKWKLLQDFRLLRCIPRCATHITINQSWNWL